MRNGATLAAAVDQIDSGAWFFIFSSLEPEWTNYIDGYIPKDEFQEMKEFMKVDFTGLETFEELYSLLPWIKPAWMTGL